MIEEEDEAAEQDDGFEDVVGEAPPVDEHQLSTRGPIVSGGQ